MTERSTLEVPAPPGGWGHPWPNVAEIARLVGHRSWTLIGGLMVHLHASVAGIHTVRPTTDVDMALHIETTPGVAAHVHHALTNAGYELQTSFDPTHETAHRYERGDDVVDVVVADHAAPRVVQRLAGHDMVAVEGGTQALKRTVNADLTIDGQTTRISVPDTLGAIVLKAAAHVADARDAERHLEDAVVLLAAIGDPIGERARLGGSDRKRLRHLRAQLPDDHAAWRTRLPDDTRRLDAQAALTLLTNGMDR